MHCRPDRRRIVTRIGNSGRRLRLDAVTPGNGLRNSDLPAGLIRSNDIANGV
jgi:hypothetical protein